jgi:excisionase family DNA binding protein
MVISEPVFTIAEVAKALRVSDETIRRKIEAGEITAIEVTSKPRKTYRILYQDLMAWLGQDKTEALFKRGEAFDEFRTLFADMTEAEQEALISEAVSWVKAKKPKREQIGKTLGKEELKQRFS